MSNQSHFVEAYFRVCQTGFVFVALNWRLTVPELSFQMLDSGATLVLYSLDQAALVQPLREQFGHVRWLADDDAGDGRDSGKGLGCRATHRRHR
jgi:fatty-acyl-CoA synthase